MCDMYCIGQYLSRLLCHREHPGLLNAGFVYDIYNILDFDSVFCVCRGSSCRLCVYIGYTIDGVRPLHVAGFGISLRAGSNIHVYGFG